jgi:hypothetical protein
MTNINSTLPRLDILEGLEKHLRSGNLGHKKWDFQSVCYQFDCGTCGCAIGELPYVFPHDFYFDKSKETIGATVIGFDCDHAVVPLNIFHVLRFEESQKEILANIFSDSERHGVMNMKDVTPLMIADAIKQFITNYRIRYPQTDE